MLRALRPCALELVQVGDVLIELCEAEEGNESIHNALLEVDLHAECALHLLIQDLGFLSGKLVILSHLDDERILVGIVVQIDEAIVEQESRITLLPI